MTPPADSPPVRLAPKQVIFLFVAAAIVGVVVFLCGVLVGRGVPIADVLTGWSQLAAFAVVDEVTEEPPAVISTPRREPSASALADANLTYYRRLAGAPVDDQVVAPRRFAAAPERQPRPPASVQPAPASSWQGGYVVQVSALRERGPAEQLAAHLAARGYPAFVSDPPADTLVSLYLVRVGGYGSRAEAEQVREQLERKEGFTPWITR